MRQEIISERHYTIGFFKAQSKDSFGITITVVHDKKATAIREAKELLVAAQKIAKEVYNAEVHNTDGTSGEG